MHSSIYNAQKLQENVDRAPPICSTMTKS